MKTTNDIFIQKHDKKTTLNKKYIVVKTRIPGDYIPNSSTFISDYGTYDTAFNYMYNCMVNTFESRTSTQFSEIRRKYNENFDAFFHKCQQLIIYSVDDEKLVPIIKKEDYIDAKIIYLWYEKSETEIKITMGHNQADNFNLYNMDIWILKML
jgi:hypothetical protein